MKIHSFANGGAIEQMGRPEFKFHYKSGTRELESAVIEVEDPAGKLITIQATPLRTVYLAAGSGYIPRPDWVHGMYQGELKVEGLSFDMSTPQARAENGPLYETLSRFELSTGEVSYGLLENLVVGIYHPDGFDDAAAVAP